MNRITIAVLLLLLAACSKDPNSPVPPPGNTNPPGNNSPNKNVYGYRYIPNLETDTLIGGTEDQIDSLFIGTNTDSSTYMIFKGVYYYVWTQSYVPLIEQPDWFEENQMLYAHVYIGTVPFDDSNALLKGVANIYPHRYYDDSYKYWKEQQQKFVITNMKPPFTEQAWGGWGFYYSIKK